MLSFNEKKNRLSIETLTTTKYALIVRLNLMYQILNNTNYKQSPQQKSFNDTLI